MYEYENQNEYIPAQPETPNSYIPYSYYSAPIPPSQPAPKKENGTRWIALALCFSLLGSILGAGSVLLLQGLFRSGTVSAEQGNSGPISYLLQGQREHTAIETVNVDTNRQLTPAEVYSANVNSTVGITTSITTTNFWGYQTTSAASGSGFLISHDGYILTNYHVIEGSDSISVSLYDGTSYDAELIGFDSSNDIAVLKIDAQQLVPVILGDSDELNVGDSVVAIGNPLGELTFSLTSGAVSAKDREITLSGNITMNLIQTDCAINSGNSGGALFNLYGEVIGVTNAKYSGSGSDASIDNIGFAIPINSIRQIVEDIIETGYITKPYTGLSVSDLSFESMLFGLPQGAAVLSVDANSPAAEAGLRSGDIITEISGTQIRSASQFLQITDSAAVGEELLLTIYRQNSYYQVSLAVTERARSALEGAA